MGGRFGGDGGMSGAPRADRMAGPMEVADRPNGRHPRVRADLARRGRCVGVRRSHPLEAIARRHGASRADIIIVTKCPPDLSVAAQSVVLQRVQRYSQPTVPVLFSAYEYGMPEALVATLNFLAPGVAVAFPGFQHFGPALLLTGIAQPGPLREHLETQG